MLELFKVSETLNHDLLAAKLEGYGFSKILLLTFKFIETTTYKGMINQIFTI